MIQEGRLESTAEPGGKWVLLTDEVEQYLTKNWSAPIQVRIEILDGQKVLCCRAAPDEGEEWKR